jgi:hypothetical protein
VREEPLLEERLLETETTWTEMLCTSGCL